MSRRTYHGNGMSSIGYLMESNAMLQFLIGMISGILVQTILERVLERH